LAESLAYFIMRRVNMVQISELPNDIFVCHIFLWKTLDPRGGWSIKEQFEELEAMLQFRQANK
jgi:hypothetical protein